jgi:hypothetical protein
VILSNQDAAATGIELHELDEFATEDLTGNHFVLPVQILGNKLTHCVDIIEEEGAWLALKHQFQVLQNVFESI